MFLKRLNYSPNKTDTVCLTHENRPTEKSGDQGFQKQRWQQSQELGPGGTPQLQWLALHGISVSRAIAPNGVHSLTLEPGSKGDFTGGIKEFAITLNSLYGPSVICVLSGKKGSRKLREEGMVAEALTEGCSLLLCSASWQLASNPNFRSVNRATLSCFKPLCFTASLWTEVYAAPWLCKHTVPFSSLVTELEKLFLKEPLGHLFMEMMDLRMVDHGNSNSNGGRW